MRLGILRHSAKPLVDALTFPTHSWSLRLSRLSLILAGSVAALLVLWFIVPALVSAVYASAGASALATAQRSPTDTRSAAQALHYFEQAQQWSPDSPAIYRQLAEAHLLLQQPDAAITALERAYSLQPESLLIQQELAQAYAAGGRAAQADAMWNRKGLLASQALAMADDFYAQHRYADALSWYERARRLQPDLPFDMTFKAAITAVLARSPTAQNWLTAAQAHDSSFTVPKLTKRLDIPGTELRWMNHYPEHQLTYGMPLAYATDGTVGVFWVAGEALSVLEVPQAGDYLLQVQVLQSTPPPIELAIGANGRVLQQARLERGDASWETIAVPLRLDPGLNTVHLWFLNDAVIDGQDRNAIIAKITIVKEEL